MANLPSYYTSPYYSDSQETLSGLGTDILSGQIPDYYSPIGQTGSTEFEDMLNMSIRDTQQGVTENAARMGFRGGRGSEMVSKAIGDISTKARYDDYLRSLQGKESLLNTGVGITEGVRGAGLTEAGQQNAFNLDKYKFEYQSEQDVLNRQQEEDNAWMEMLTAGIGVAGNVVGAMYLGGFPLGSAATTAMKAGGNPTNKSYAGGYMSSYLD